jgi:uncharacterized LabA/DUF88 family protein/cold shock CspA family protein
MTTPKNLSHLTKIGVFYDGNYFLHVSNYYNYNHPRKARISIKGLHQFIRQQIADAEITDVNLCQIVDAHYFRGRLNAQEASQKGNLLYYDRVFDDILMYEGVTTHYLPVKGNTGTRQEKGIDVWLALEAFEQVFYKRFDVVVLISSDGDYVPLIRKINTLGTRVMVLSWDFEYTNDEGIKMVTRTSQDLLEEVTYPIAMHELIETQYGRNNPIVDNIFVQTAPKFTPPPPNTGTYDDGVERHISTVHSLKSGYGFINYPPNNLFFHYTNLVETDFNELREGDEVEFTLDLNEKGEQIAKNVRLLYDEDQPMSMGESSEIIL